MKQSMQPVHAIKEGVHQQLATFLGRQHASKRVHHNLRLLEVHVENVAGGHAIGQSQHVGYTVIVVEGWLEVEGPAARTRRKASVHCVGRSFAGCQARPGKMVTLTGSRLANRRNARVAEMGKRVRAVDPRAAKRKMFKGEGGAFCIADGVLVLAVRGTAHWRINICSRRFSGWRCRDFGAHCCQALLEIRRDERTRLEESSLERIDTVCQVCKILGCGVV